MRDNCILDADSSSYPPEFPYEYIQCGCKYCRAALADEGLYLDAYGAENNRREFRLMENTAKQYIFTVKDPANGASLYFDLRSIHQICLPSYLSLGPDKNKNVAIIAFGSFQMQCPWGVADKVRAAWFEYNGYEQPSEPTLVPDGFLRQ